MNPIILCMHQIKTNKKTDCHRFLKPQVSRHFLQKRYNPVELFPIFNVSQ